MDDVVFIRLIGIAFAAAVMVAIWLDDPGRNVVIIKWAWAKKWPAALSVIVGGAYLYYPPLVLGILVVSLLIIFVFQVGIVLITEDLDKLAKYINRKKNSQREE